MCCPTPRPMNWSLLSRVWQINSLTLAAVGEWNHRNCHCWYFLLKGLMKTTLTKSIWALPKLHENSGSEPVLRSRWPPTSSYRWSWEVWTERLLESAQTHPNQLLQFSVCSKFCTFFLFFLFLQTKATF